MSDQPLSPKKRALRLIRNFEAHLASGDQPAPQSYFEYMNIRDLITAFERGDATEAMLLAKVQQLEGQA